MADLLGVIRSAQTITDRVLVSYSGGKDSIVTLDLCAKHFGTVQAFFMYQVPGLSFQERILKWAERKYGLEILRVPHWDLSDYMRLGAWHAPDDDVSKLRTIDIYGHVRQKTGIWWIAAGERIADSIVRRAMITRDGSINDKRGRIFPLAHWRKRDVVAYVRREKLRVSEETEVLGFSFRDIDPKSLYLVKQHYPADYERILEFFPLAEAGVKWYELYRTDRQPEQVSEV